jgi:hypothetical protein
MDIAETIQLVNVSGTLAEIDSFPLGRSPLKYLVQILFETLFLFII